MMFGKGLSVQKRFANFRMYFFDFCNLIGEESYSDRLTYDGHRGWGSQPHLPHPVRTLCNRTAGHRSGYVGVPWYLRKADNLFERIVIRATIGGPTDLQPVRNYGTP